VGGRREQGVHHLLGARGRGYAQFLRILDEGRVAIAALATGLAQGCVDECVSHASNAAMDNARAVPQVFGGYGFMNSSPVGRFYRDAKILEIGEGTSEVQRMLIARELGLGQ
jgi:alkylation response protein AidB-like acyl-CoA dehydrogenase